ncbi:MAG TPA: DNRLRE domain-containing protein, partial [Acidimicrobiia bacterium]|nr:DNRLRE domain-containing protein [Acidimicrobiia bacterium]
MFGQAVSAIVLPSSARAAATVVFTPVADASVYSKDDEDNFGSDPELTADRSPKAKSFLRFDLSGLTQTPLGATLRLFVTNGSYNGPEVRPVRSAWDEGTVTYDTRASVGSVVADVRKVSAGNWVEYDVSELVTGNGPVEVALAGDSSDGTDFVSREGAESQRPQLVLEVEGDVEPPPPPPPPPP